MSTTRARRHRRKLKADINVVPYIDVMLVLLVIFMVTAPLLSLSVDVDLPRSDARPTQQQKEPVIVEVDAEGRYFLRFEGGAREPVAANELEAKVAALVRNNPEAPVYVAAPGDADYQRVMTTMVLLQRAGVPRVSLVSQPGDAR